MPPASAYMCWRHINNATFDQKQARANAKLQDWATVKVRYLHYQETCYDTDIFSQSRQLTPTNVFLWVAGALFPT